MTERTLVLVKPDGVERKLIGEVLSRIERKGPSSLTGPDRLARALGWFSIGLGVTELVAPGQIARTLGLEGKEGLIRAYGARELAHQLGAGQRLF